MLNSLKVSKIYTKRNFNKFDIFVAEMNIIQFSLTFNVLNLIATCILEMVFFLVTYTRLLHDMFQTVIFYFWCTNLLCVWNCLSKVCFSFHLVKLAYLWSSPLIFQAMYNNVLEPNEYSRHFLSDHNMCMYNLYF